jgi:hypothetical protein
MSAPVAAGAALTPWWVAYPQVWELEQKELAAAGATWAPLDLDQLTAGPSGSIAPPARGLLVSWPHPAPQPGDPDRLELSIHYPRQFPWFPPTVLLPQPLAGLRRHRDPVMGTLCLLGGEQEWLPGTTLAALLITQLPLLLAAGRTSGAEPATLALETGAEPVWTRLLPARGGLLTESACLPPAGVPGGMATLAVVGARPPVHALVRLLDGDGELLAASRPYGHLESVQVPWVRLADLPSGRLFPADLWRRGWTQLAATVPTATHVPGVQTLLLLVPSETGNRQPREEHLLLTLRAARTDEHAAASGPTPPGQLPLFPVTDLWPADPDAAETEQASARARLRVAVHRSHAIGRDDLAARLPGDTGQQLSGATVTVVGVGALGGPIALELARAGVGTMHLVDGDRHEAATGSRQLPAVADAGEYKALAVARRILEHNPHVELSCGFRHLGRDDGQELPRLTGSDLVVDAAANPTVSRFLAAHLRRAGTPLLIASATAGGWGGVIVAQPAAGGGCWECAQLHRAHRKLPWPPAEDGAWLTPAGCSEATFVGGAFDLGEVALQTVRTALAIITATADAVRRSPYGDVQVLSLRGRRGPQQPRWQSRRLTVHADCPLHAAGSPPPPAYPLHQSPLRRGMQ